MSYTYAILEVSSAAYTEIRAALVAAGYGQALHNWDTADELIDMHGIALQSQPEKVEA